MHQSAQMTWTQAAVRAIGWLAALCLIAGAIHLFGSTQAEYYVGYLAAPAGVIVALLSRLAHKTWRVPVMIYVIGVCAGIALALLGLAFAGTR